MKPHPRVAAKRARIRKARRFKALARYMTYQAIGAAQEPPISRQRVGVMIKRLEKAE